MSMIEKQIEELKNLRLRLGCCEKVGTYDWSIVDNAIDTIQALSAKLSASNLNGGWHVVADGDLPKLKERSDCFFSDNVIIQTKKGVRKDTFRLERYCEWDGEKNYYEFAWLSHSDCLEQYGLNEVIAWMPLPEAYSKEVQHG